MPRSRPPYAPENRRQMIELVRAGRTPEEPAPEFEPSAQAIRNLRKLGPCSTRWTRRSDNDARTRSFIIPTVNISEPMP